MFCNAWRPRQSNFYIALFISHFAWQNVLQQCLLLCVIAFLCNGPRRCPCHRGRCILFFAMLRICASSVQCFTLDLQFKHCKKKCVLQCTNRTALVIIGRILEHCNFYTGVVKNEAVQNRTDVLGQAAMQPKENEKKRKKKKTEKKKKKNQKSKKSKKSKREKKEASKGPRDGSKN